MATHSSILAWKTHGQRSLVGCSPWGRKGSGTIERLTLTYVEYTSDQGSNLCPLLWQEAS